MNKLLCRILCKLLDVAMIVGSIVLTPIFWLLAMTIGRRQHVKDMEERSRYSGGRPPRSRYFQRTTGPSP